MAQGPAQTQPFDDGDDDEKLNVRGTRKVPFSLPSMPLSTPQTPLNSPYHYLWNLYSAALASVPVNKARFARRDEL